MSTANVVMTVLPVAAMVFAINLPFGYWRANVRKFSASWFLAVHGPVPAVVLLRILSGLGFSFSTLPFMVGAFFGGQVLGSRIFSRRRSRAEEPLTSCLVWDLVKSSGRDRMS
jgi:hypothetical protein